MKALYKSPSVRFESLQLRENIADPCWAYASNGKQTTFYYDTPGAGYLVFELSGKGCGQAELNLVRRVPTDNPANVANILAKGNSGEPYGGKFSTCVPSS